MNDKAIALLERLIKLAKPQGEAIKVLYHILTIIKLYKEMQDDE